MVPETNSLKEFLSSTYFSKACGSFYIAAILLCLINLVFIVIYSSWWVMIIDVILLVLVTMDFVGRILNNTSSMNLFLKSWESMLEITILILYVTLLSLEMFIDGYIGTLVAACAYIIFIIRNIWRLI